MNMYLPGSHMNQVGDQCYCQNQELSEQQRYHHDQMDCDFQDEMSGSSPRGCRCCRCCNDNNFDWYECHRPYPPRLNCKCECKPVPKKCGCVPVPTRRDNGKIVSVQNGQYVLVDPCVLCEECEDEHCHRPHPHPPHCEECEDEHCHCPHPHPPHHHDNSFDEQGVALPENLGFKAWTLRLEDSNTSLPVTGSVPYAVKLFIRKRMFVSQIAFHVITPAGAVIGGQNSVGLHAANGALIAQSGDISSLLSTPGFAYAPIPGVWLDPGEYWVLFVFNGSSSPFLMGSNLNSTVINAGLTGAYLRAGSLNAGHTTHPSRINPGALAPQQLLWVALN